MCALTAARRGRKVAVLDHAAKPGGKLIISGGGRCNFTNREVSAENFVSENRHFAKSALSRFGPADFIAMVEAHGIGYHEKELGQLFCDESSKQIVAMLIEECRRAGVRIDPATAVTDVMATASGFRLRTAPSHEGGSR
ncbi:MAG: NAD(P)/FAD-dependent oxidoreductase, partial [Elusimicrobia bacterium]|nr:NAD(P)/FAD-dependent oxidoreductase [Elusimicrobiota bacterium]